MSKLQSINPYELLGIDEKSTIKDARKAYYQLALLVHPDCGGDEDSMKVLVNAYGFVEEQLRNKRDISGDADEFGKSLEEDFKEYNDRVKAEMPQIRDLFDMANEEQRKDAKKRNFQVYNHIFNKEFEEECKDDFPNPFDDGYGELMDVGPHDESIPTTSTKNKFTQEIQIYKEPHVLPDTYGSNFRYDIKSIDDYSNYEEKEYDYKKAHTEKETKPIKEDEEVNDLSKKLEALIKNRKRLVVKKTTIELGIPKSKVELDIIDEED